MKVVVDFLDVVRSSPFSYQNAERYVESMLSTTLVVSLLYVVVIFSIKAFMTNRKPLQLRPILIVWNGFLSIFSILGSYYTTKALYTDIQTHGFTGSYCKFGEFIPGQYGLWGFFFALSKLIEVGDTILLVLRKKPLIFLHWYHHMITMNFAMLAYTSRNGFAGWMCWMNFSVHAIMYTYVTFLSSNFSYYLISSCGYRVPTIISQCITSSQLLQFLTTLVQFIHIGLMGSSCDFELNTYLFGLAMTISYVFLFGHFFYKAYVHNGGRKFKKQKQT
ncbi:hypothetical protein L596_001695 [Steinernema carpocapsae]|uniref:Elongation of very long chain fatty acids protein n=1 Tax=Steinernema carpocapsae TaxID=34508 RepID=A0A4U8UMI1_STECR|nr:hypothetical protein L596_001695 [Steinernema carpocapsae]